MSLKTNHLFNSNNELNCVNTALTDLIAGMPYVAHLKNAQTGKYIQSSFPWAEKLGLESTDDIVGLTIDDLTGRDGIYTKWDFSCSFIYWKDNLPKEIKKLEYQAQITRRRASVQRTYFTSEGFILFSNLVKQPIFSFDKQRIIAIFTCSEDVTFQHNLFDLLKLYQKYYSEENAIQKLLMYLEIDDYFTELPTLEEMQILFTMCQDSDFSEITTPHTSYLRNKVETGLWNDMFTRLRVISTHEYNA